METKEENMGKEEELPKKKELLSDEELLGVAGGGGWYKGCSCFICCRISDKNEEQKCLSHCSGGRVPYNN